MRQEAGAASDDLIYSSLPSEVRRRPLFRIREQYIHTIQKLSWTESNVIITDLRTVDFQPRGLPLLISTLYPEQNVSLQVFNKRHSAWTVISAAYSISNPTCNAHIGELMHAFGGGGNRSMGSCRVDKSEADDVLANIIAHLKEWCRKDDETELSPYLKASP